MGQAAKNNPQKHHQHNGKRKLTPLTRILQWDLKNII